VVLELYPEELQQLEVVAELQELVEEEEEAELQQLVEVAVLQQLWQPQLHQMN
jgi:hypothetical protein